MLLYCMLNVESLAEVETVVSPELLFQKFMIYLLNTQLKRRGENTSR